jgi:hypothetical protein
MSKGQGKYQKNALLHCQEEALALAADFVSRRCMDYLKSDFRNGLTREL